MNFMTVKMVKFMRDLKKPRHSYMKQPLGSHVVTQSCPLSQFEKNKPLFIFDPSAQQKKLHCCMEVPGSNPN